MASRKFKLIAASGAIAIAAGYGLYVTAQTAPPELAQAPMNITNVIPPAFVMALDDSGSMRFQTLFPARDGGALWGRDSSSGTGNVYSFFHNTGTFANQLRGTDPNTAGRQFVHVAPYPAPRQTNPDDDNAAIPPIDAFGFSRSHVFNPAYFNPNTAYGPWKTPTGDDWAAAVPSATRVDPNSATPVVNLTVETTNTSNNNASHHAFRIRTGMVLPAGMKFNGAPGCGLTNGNSSGSTPSGWRVLDADVTASCNVNAYIAYFPATFYLPESAPAPSGFIEANRVLASNACSYRGASGANECNMYRYEIRPANYTGGAAGTAYQAAIQNFANWFSFYGARNRAMVAAITNSLVDARNIRVGYFTINNRVTATMRNFADAAEKQDFYDSVVTLTASGNTPNLQAVAHLGAQFERVDAGAPIKLACQKNAGMLFTDGLSNVAGPTVGNVDGSMGTPFQDSHSNTLADIATRYYLNTADGGRAPLRSGVGFAGGQVPVSSACNTLPLGSAERKKLDCQTNLHMNFYGVTLGATGETFNANTPRDPFESPYIAWPAFESAERSTVDDIWHATVNTRGEFINARTPADITTAMRRILAAVNDGATPSGTIGGTGARIGVGSLSVQPRYESTNNGTDWYGQLRAEAVTTNPLTGLAGFATVWEASARLAAQGAAARNIRFGRTTNSVVPSVSAFTAGNVSLADICSNSFRVVSCTPTAIQALASGMNNTRAIAYLRGDRTDEGVLRTRSGILGDIVNSSPVVASATDDYGYRALGGAVGTSYATFLASKKAANRPLVFVGANDGMFHVFDGRAASPGGDEVMGYVPATALGHMGNLLFPYNAADQNNQKFQHRYFVDGPIAVSDVYAGGAWRTIVVGTSGAGGRSVFALDVTNPSAPTVLWEINNLLTGASAISGNIGHVLGRPVIVPVKDTAGAVSWKVIFGNGYNSANQQARLFVVDAVSGSVSTILAAEASPPAFNGLGSVAVVDRKRVDGATITAGRDGYSDTVYAADQNGAVWKFDLLSNALALSAPLYVARDAANVRQSITGGITTATGPAGGVMVYFGTGSFSFTGDPGNTATQSLYAVLDNGASVTGRSQLLAQSVGATTGSFRSTSSNQMTAGRSGWYLDLPSGERFVGNPRIESGIVFFPTYEPSSAATTDCSVNGKNWLYGLNSLSGAAALTNVRVGSPTGSQPAAATGAVALNTSGSAPVRDVSALTSPRLAPLTGTPTQAQIDAALAAQCSMVIRVAGADPLYLPRPCGRQSWRQVR